MKVTDLLFFAFKSFYTIHASPSAPECYKSVHNEDVCICTHLNTVFFICLFEGNKMTVSHSLVLLLFLINFLCALVLLYFWSPSVNAPRKLLMIIQILTMLFSLPDLGLTKKFIQALL